MRKLLLHYNMAAAPSDFLETMFCKNGTYFFAR